MDLRPDTVTDFGQFAGLRAEARAQSPEALRKTARQFESLLTQQLLKSMRAATPGDELTGGGQTGFYRDMFDQQLAVHLSNGKGMGIADLLVRQLQKQSGAPTDPAAADLGSAAGRHSGIGATTLHALPARGALSAFAAPQLAKSAEASAPIAARREALQARALLSGQPSMLSTDAGVAARSARPRSAAEFVEAVRPHAEAAAAELGVPARVLIAQAALETGWGRKAIRRDDGSSSFNYFGIKADRRWNGADVQRQTTEYVDGTPQREAARFRAYDSAGASFNDYVRFLKSNPRYAEALRHGGDERRFVAGLQKAGYATDPAYAQKILRVAYGRTMNAAMTVPATPATPAIASPASPRLLSV
ncbi:MAG TPA: flagellar assembly peptidoglycan hydrolase FlgJ [Solimonas sp.]